MRLQLFLLLNLNLSGRKELDLLPLGPEPSDLPMIYAPKKKLAEVADGKFFRYVRFANPFLKILSAPRKLSVPLGGIEPPSYP